MGTAPESSGPGRRDGGAKEGAAPSLAGMRAAPQPDSTHHLSEAAFRVTRDPILLSDTNHRIIRSNPAAERLFNVPEEQIVGRFCWEVIHGTGQPPPGCTLCRLEEETRSTTIELQLNGRWIQVDMDPLFQEGTGTFLGAVHILKDVTERKTAEQVLAESEQRYRDLVEHAPMGIWVEQDDRVVFANPAAAKMLGADSPEQLIGVHPLSFLSPEQLAAAQDRRARTLAGEQGLYPAETTWVKLDGSALQVAVKAGLMKYGGRPAIQLMATDITARKQAEEALRAERDRFATIARTFPGVICVFRQAEDGSTFFLYASPTTQEICGFTFEELASEATPLWLRVHPADRHRVRESLLESARLLSPWDCEFRYHHPARDEIWLEGHFAPSREPDESTVWTGIFLDATERKRAEAEREAMQAQLFEAQKMEAVGRIAGGVAHDFNNMLSIILGYGQNLLNQLPPDNSAREDLEEILLAAQRCTELTRQLLILSRRQSVRPEIVDLNKALADMQPVLTGVLGEDIKLVVTLAEDVGPVSIDRSHLQHAVVNLLVNAKEAMPQGGRVFLQTKKVHLAQRDVLPASDLKEGIYNVLSVTDTGSGIPPDILPHIFEPFFTTKEPGTGSGLGLPVVQGIIKQSGGAVTVRSESGGGTTFEIYLPQADAPAGVAPELAAVTSGSSRPARRRHILVVEDESSLRVLFERMLGELGYQVTLAADGNEALSLTENGLRPDILLTDVVMPGMSGPSLAATLRRQQPDLPVIFMSGYPDDAIDRHGGLESGIPFLQKPVTMSSLIAALNQVLSDDQD